MKGFTRGTLYTSSLVLILMLTAGCGFHVMSFGKADSLTGDVKSVAVPFFVNDTKRTGIEVTLTTALIDELSTTVHVVSDGTEEGIVTGFIKEYTLTPISYTNNDVVGVYRLSVLMAVTLKRKSDDELLWEDRFLSDFEDFAVDETSVAATKGREADALGRIADDISRLIKERMVEGF